MFSDSVSTMIDAFESGRWSRRQLVAGFGAVVAAAAGLPRLARGEQDRASAGEGADKPTFRAIGLNHIALNVTDLEKSSAWYAKHLGMEPWSRSARSSFMGFGDAFLAMFLADQPGLNHYCYTIKNYDAGDAMKTLEAAGLKPRRERNRVYFDDPNGITVQVAAPND